MMGGNAPPSHPEMNLLIPGIFLPHHDHSALDPLVSAPKGCDVLPMYVEGYVNNNADTFAFAYLALIIISERRGWKEVVARFLSLITLGIPPDVK